MTGNAYQGRGDIGDIATGEDMFHARCRKRLRYIYIADAGMCVGAAEKAQMQHARQLDITDIAATAAHQLLHVHPPDGLANFRVLSEQMWGGIGHHTFPVPDGPCFMTFSTASIIA